jgi:hypothetical protein
MPKGWRNEGIVPGFSDGGHEPQVRGTRPGWSAVPLACVIIPVQDVNTTMTGEGRQAVQGYNGSALQASNGAAMRAAAGTAPCSQDAGTSSPG